MDSLCSSCYKCMPIENALKLFSFKRVIRSLEELLNFLNEVERVEEQMIDFLGGYGCKRKKKTSLAGKR